MAHDYVFGFWNDRTKAQVHPADDVYTKSQADYIFATYSVVDARYTPLYSHNHREWDTAPTSDSTKPVTSGGIKSALDTLDAALDSRLDAIETWIGDAILTPLADYVVEEGELPTWHSETVDTTEGHSQDAMTWYNNENVTWHYKIWKSGKIEAWADQEAFWVPEVQWGPLYRGYTIARQELPFKWKDNFTPPTGETPSEVYNDKKDYLFKVAPETCTVEITGFGASCMTVRGHYDWLLRDMSSAGAIVYGNDAPPAPKPGESTYKFFPATDNSYSRSNFYIQYYVAGKNPDQEDITT